MTDITSGFDKGDDNRVIEILNKWDGGPLSNKLFTALSGIIPTPCVEVVILRKKRKKVEVLLISRPKNDKAWPGKIHSPGGSFRLSDYYRKDNKPINGIFERVQKNELKTKFVKEPEFVGNSQHLTSRGPEVVNIYLGKIKTNSKLPKNWLWVDVENLGGVKNSLEHQIKVINMARDYFTSSNHLPSLYPVEFQKKSV